jgi:hypothetical protein
MFAFPAQAQTDQERAAARTAAVSGIKAYEAKDYEKALALLVRAENVVHAPTHLLFIARSHEALGHLVEATETYRRIINETLSEKASSGFVQAHEAAQAELPAVIKRIPSLEIHVSGADADSLEVTVDGKAFPNVGIGLPTPINPGSHVVVASASGKKPAEVRVTLEEKQTESVTLELVDDEGSPAQAKEAGIGAEIEPETPDRSGKRVGAPVIATMIASGVFLATGSAFGILALGQNGKFQDTNDGTDEDGATQYRNQARTFGIVADVGFGAAALSAGVAVILYATSSKGSAEVGRTRVIPAVGQNSFSLQLRSGF